MTFLEPANLHWLWLAAIPVALWLFRRQAKRVPVSTLLFFRSLAREHQESAWLRQVKRWLSLLLTLLVLLLAVLALSRPSGGGDGANTEALVVLLDHSASMALVEEGKSRLEVAKELIRNRVRGLPETAVVSLVLYADGVQVPLSRSRKKRELIRRLEEVKPVGAEDRTERGWEAALRLAQVDAPAVVFHVSDHSLPETETKKDGIRYERGAVEAAEAMNAGITGFELRGAPLERNKFEGFLRVGAAKSNLGEVTTTVEVKVGGRLMQLRELDLKPGAEVSLTLPLEGVSGELLEVRVATPGDGLGLDDVVLAPLPVVKPLVVAWLAEKADPFTDLALGSMVEAGRVEILKGEASQWPLKVKPDVYVLENWLPTDRKPDVPVVLLTPRGVAGRFDALERAVPVDRVRALNAEHPVVHGVTTARLSVTQTVRLAAGEGLEVLWMGGDEPLLLAGELNGQRAVVTGFSPSRSEQLALLPSFPLLLANAILWCGEGEGRGRSVKPYRVGDVIQVAGELRWNAWDGRSLRPVVTASQSGLVQFSELGAWESADGVRGATVLASWPETDVPSRAKDAVAMEQADRSGWGWSVITLLLGAVLGLMLLESWLFHRQAVY